MKKSYFKQTLITASTCLLGMSILVGCGEASNPLMTEQSIKNLKMEVMVGHAFIDRGVYICTPYLADPQANQAVEEKCVGWSKKMYDLLLEKGSIPHTVTYKQFTDPALWQILTQK